MIPKCHCPPELAFHLPRCPYFDSAFDPPGFVEDPPIDTEASYAYALKHYPAAVTPSFVVPDALPFEPDSPADPDRSWAKRDSGE